MMTQAAGSLTTYGLLVWDSQLETPSENMDDYLFYTKALTKGLEFILATAIVVGGNEQSPDFINLLRNPGIDFHPSGIDSWAP
jgi:hypothetical protein